MSLIVNWFLAEDEIVFADRGNISAYALEAVGEMQQAGIISGRDDNTFDPKANATRAESSKNDCLTDADDGESVKIN